MRMDYSWIGRDIDSIGENIEGNKQGLYQFVLSQAQTESFLFNPCRIPQNQGRFSAIRHNKYNRMSKLSSSYHDDDNYDDQQDLYSTRKSKKKEAPPRFIKNGIDNVNPEEIVVNLSKTHYDIIQTVVEELGWVVERSKKSEKWDIMWTDWHIQAQDLFKLNDQQKISHFPAIYVLAKKNFLGRGLMKMNKVFPQQYNYFPFTWSVPAEIGELMRYDALIAEEEKPIYIFKPEASSQGKGIMLFTKIEELQGKTGIVQLYVNNPLLVDSLKFDMRIYVLIYGCDPVRIYIYEEGLARFATQNYQKAKKKNLKDNFIHLTNYAINKTNKKFVFNTSETNMSVGHKRSLTSIFNLLKNKGFNVQEIKRKIDRLIVKTLLVGKPMLEHMYGLSQTDNLANDHCFQILGFDVMINEQLEPILLEVNHTPSFVTDTPLDKTIKKNLIKETLLLLNVNVQTKKAKIQKKIEFDQKRAQRKLTKLSAQQKIELKKQIEKEKNEYEAATLKKFRRLYPVEGNEYSEMQEYACKIFNEQSGIKNKQVPIALKKSTQLRPASLQNMPTAKKLRQSKKQQSNPKDTAIRRPTPVQQVIDKLPDISPNKKAALKSSSIISPKTFVKSYEFSPEKIFANLTQKYTQRLQYNQRLVENSSIFMQRQKMSDSKRQGGYVQPKMLKLTEIASKNMPTMDQLALTYNMTLQKSDRKIRKTFLDFVSASNHDKNLIINERNSIALVKKDPRVVIRQEPMRKPKRGRNGILQDFIQEEVFTMKSLNLNKNNRHHL